MTDFATVYGWINSTFLKEKRIKVQRMSDVLVRRRLGPIEDAISECQLTVHVIKVSYDQNKAGKLTRVLKKWLSREIQNTACVADKKSPACTNRNSQAYTFWLKQDSLFFSQISAYWKKEISMWKNHGIV